MNRYVVQWSSTGNWYAGDSASGIGWARPADKSQRKVFATRNEAEIAASHYTKGCCRVLRLRDKRSALEAAVIQAACDVVDATGRQGVERSVQVEAGERLVRAVDAYNEKGGMQ